MGLVVECLEYVRLPFVVARVRERVGVRRFHVPPHPLGHGRQSVRELVFFRYEHYLQTNTNAHVLLRCCHHNWLRFLG